MHYSFSFRYYFGFFVSFVDVYGCFVSSLSFIFLHRTLIIVTSFLSRFVCLFVCEQYFARPAVLVSMEMFEYVSQAENETVIFFFFLRLIKSD